MNTSTKSTAKVATTRSSRTTAHLLSARRALVCLAIGLVAGAAFAVITSPRLFLLVMWTVTVGLLLTWVWARSWSQDCDGVEHLAEQERTTRSTDVWLLTASVASFGIVLLALVQSSSRRDPTAVASSCCAWSAWCSPGGMSYAVSDTGSAATATGRVVLGHALLSYAFGTGVLAVAINLVTNLGQ